MLSFKDKVSFATGRLGTSITINMTDLFTGFVYYAFFGLKESPFLAFAGVAIGKLVIALSSYLGGFLSDRTNSLRWGRRKPFVIFGAPLLALSFFFLFTPHIWLAGTDNELIIFGWLLLFNSLYQGLYGFILTPFQAWLPEIANEDEWLEVSGYQNTFNLFAFIIGAGSAFLLPALIGKEEDVDFTQADFNTANEFIPSLTNGEIITTIIVLFTLSVIIFFLPSLLIKAKEIHIPQPTFSEELKVVLANRNYINWTISRGILSIMLSGLIGIVLAWISDVLNFKTLEYILFGLVLIITLFIFYVFWIKFGNKHGKTKTYLYAMTYLGLILPFMSLIGNIDLSISVFSLGMIYAILGAVGLAGYFILPYAIVADIIEDDERRSGESRAGIYYGFEAVPLNFFQFLGYLLIGVLLELPKFTNYLGTEYSWGYVIFGPLASICVFISVFIFWKRVDADPSSKRKEKIEIFKG
ncbi:MAG: MFS transporter [Candidatus Hodarchaeales archaeon]|jgi:GPH family glycoside/pentoside/hexuronide:cation symporter